MGKGEKSILLCCVVECLLHARQCMVEHLLYSRQCAPCSMPHAGYQWSQCHTGSKELVCWQADRKKSQDSVVGTWMVMGTCRICEVM